MNKKILLTFLILFTVAASISAVSASDVNVTDSYTTSLVDVTSDVSVPLENSADSSGLSVSSDSNVDNDSSKVSLSSDEVLESEDSNTLSTNNNSDSDPLYSSDNGSTILSSGDEIVSINSSSTVSKTITAKDYTKYYKGSTQYTATFLDANGNPLANANVKITVNGVTYTKKTDSKGVASLAIDLKPGTYKVTAVNPETGYTLTTTFRILSTITASNVNKVYTDGKKFTATFYKSNGKVLANKYIKFKLNGRTYNVKTNSKGVASLSLLTLGVGTHKIVSYNTDGLYQTNTIKVVRSTTTSLTTNPYVFLKSNSKVIKVKLLNKFGYAPGKGKVITFKVNGKTYSATTNAYGVAKLKLPSLSVGTYTVVYRFAGNNFYKASSAKNTVTVIAKNNPVLTVKSTTTFGHGANTPFKVALTADGIPIPNKTIKFTVNGKTYTKTTNANGIASLTINLPIGKYTVTYKSQGVSNKLSSKTGSTAITVKERSPTKITWKSGTSFYQGSQTFKVLLQDSNNKALSGKTVKMVVNSKTYTATTDSNGYAQFKVNVGAGNSTVTFKYEASGDNDNAPSSGSAKISVARKAASGYGYWLFGANMKKVNLNTLASKGTTDIFLNYYAITLHGKSAVESWIASANKVGINVHIWMQTFYDGGWINPVSNGKANTALFKQIINEALGYAKIKGVAGIHFDYMRYPGTAYKTSGGTAAITQFAKQACEALHDYDPNLIVSCALMPETTSNTYYYGQDMAQISKYMDVVIPMIYKGNYGKSTSWIKTTTKWFVDNSNGAQVWAGLQGYKSDSNTAKLSLSEITQDSQNARNGGGAGVVIFRWELSNLVDFASLKASSTATSDSGTVSTSAGKTISIKDIITGSTNLKNYYQNNDALPATVTAGGVTFKLPEFLYLMSQAIYQIGNSNMKDITYITGVSEPSSPSGDSVNMQVTTDNYIDWAQRVANFIVEYKQAPNYATVSEKKVIYSEVVDAFSRILAWYGNYNNQLPNYVTVTTSGGSSDSSSASVTGKGINEVNTETSLSKYLQATTNCQVKNSDIVNKAKDLTKGLTSELSKAKAIYNYVRDEISYSFYYNTKNGAVGTLNAGSGNCVDQAHLVIALFRAAGLEARYVHGTCKFSSGSTYGHVWAQVLVGNTWYVADPTSSRNSLGTINNWNTNSFTLNGIYASLSF
ncbi:Ig-like domain repeat protein [Methanobrevibacter sp.]|uniref:transglutaminase domain-containing protein n=1 Tax=Methanobrevibacter sp. TaxID=66852 RepID=UPI0025CB82AF|nr:Ig-like domain repeat protein [Methanobrevibacter sp.]MBQ2665399.1 Ig-like domain repeat protein [Methanobrevibacter sp.]